MSLKHTAPKVPLLWAIVALCLVVGLVVTGVLVARQMQLSAIETFEDCKNARGEIMESYPEQCRINGKTFVNDAQLPGTGEVFVGLSEQEALDKAAREQIPARVIERDGQPLPATMDFVYGRHNFSVKDGRVYAVCVEGEATDSPLQE